MGIEELITRAEGKTLEFKRDASSPEGIVKTAVALANSAGGTIVIGVTDRNREIVGVADPLATEERLSSILVDSISPGMAPQIDVVPFRRTAVIVIRVHPGGSRPYHVRRLGPDQGVYVRVGSTNRRADAAQIAELARSAVGRSFDEEPAVGCVVDDLDRDAIAGAFEGRHEMDLSALRTLHLIVNAGGRDVPTVGGVLLFGRNRTEMYPDAVIACARFAGPTRSVFVDSSTFEGPLPHAVRDALSFVRRNISRGHAIDDRRRTDVWEYPLDAVDEIVVNAVVHADYSLPGVRTRVAIFEDRLEVDSPGMLMPGLTVEDLRAGVSRVRNRVIARVFREIGLIEQWGTGIPRAIEACRSAGLPEPRIEETGTGVRVTLSSTRDTAEVDPLDATIMDSLQGGHGLSTSEVAALIGRTPRSARDRLRGLVDSGLVVEVGSSPNDPQRKYFIAEEGARYRTR